MTPLEDLVLGPMRYNSEEQCWHATLQAGGRAIIISVEGESAPDAVLLRNANAVAADFQSFEARVVDFLRRESVKREWAGLGYEDEINHLTIERVDFPWEDQPASGTVFFESGLHGRLWRCHFDGRTMRSLVFDS
jgi:hypothetical protein